MLGDFAQHAAIATADNQHPPGQAMSQDRHVGEHLVVDEFVGLGGLHHTVERHDAPHAGILENGQMLMLGATFIQHPVYREALAVSLVESFLIVAHGYLP